MAAAKDNKVEKELWIRFVVATLEGLKLSTKGIEPDDVADEAVEIATKVADSLLDEYEGRYGSARARRDRRKRGEREEPDDEDDEDEDEDDEDEDDEDGE